MTSDPGATLMVSFFSGSFPGFKMSDNFIVRLSTVSLGKITGSWSKKIVNKFFAQNQTVLFLRSKKDTQSIEYQNS